MKTIHLSLLVLTSLFISPLFSQEYIALPEEDGFWKVEHYGPDCFDEYPYGGLCSVSQFYLEGDTLINETLYHKIYENGMYFNSYPQPPSYWGTHYRGCYRNDIVNKKVFYISNYDNPNEEVLLYDFNLEIGDTVQTYLTLSAQIPKIVESIDSILISSIDNIYAKRYKLSDLMDLYIVEGIGSMGGIVDEILDGFEHANDVICFQNENSDLNWDNGGNNSCDIISKIPEIAICNSEMTISPNPAHSKIEVILPKTIDDSNVVIHFYQINGDLLKTVKINHSSSIISVESFNQGVYLVEVLVDGSSLMRSKFIKL